MLHDIDHKIENEEQERKDDNIKIYARFVSFDLISRDVNTVFRSRSLECK